MNSATNTRNTIQIHRDVFGPGERSNGARFRDEISVCTRCNRVTVTRVDGGTQCHGRLEDKLVRRIDAMSAAARNGFGRRLSPVQRNKLVPAPCDGLRLPPTAIRGPRWY